MYAFVIKLCNALIKGLGAVVKALVFLLPNSPFQALSTGTVSKYFGYINYFVPVGAMVVVLEGWVACIACYYIYQCVLRWGKIIE